MPRRLPRQLARLADIAIPVGVALFLVLVLGDDTQGGVPTRGLLVVGLVLAVAQGAALRWRRSHPELVTAVAVLGGLGYQLVAPWIVLPIAGYFAVFALAATRPPHVSLVGLAGLTGLAATNVFTATAEDTVFAIVVALGVWALGEAGRSRRMAIAQSARRAVSEEQARIARELHDVIAHSVSVIVVQASAADDVFDERPDQARAALRSIEQAGRDALGELRRLLSAVRPDAATDPGGPQPGTGSCRRRSPTRCATPARRAPRCSCAASPTSSRWTCATTGARLRTARPGTA